MLCSLLDYSSSIFPFLNEFGEFGKQISFAIHEGLVSEFSINNSSIKLLEENTRKMALNI
jgi:hypothetical protein